MKKYFISLEGKQDGPFTLEELKAKNLSDKYLVWQDGFEDWKSILAVEGLQDTVLKLPPSIEENKKIKDAKEIYKFTGIVIMVGLFIIIYLKAGGTDDKYDLFENYLGNRYPSTDTDSLSTQVRVLIGATSLIIGAVIGLLVYFYGMMRTYKAAYKKQL
ncbi:MAG: DUF4339 domain-containing protein [Weeksellaceae bacterium]|nr:DUF4339 domain-containing protein [Weeksellaceae bacterium]